MTRELLERANALHNRKISLNNQLNELQKLEREPAPFVLCSRHTESGVVLDDLPQAYLDAVVDLLVGAFSREIAKAETVFAELSTEEVHHDE